jgi:very-short-patch-repair endonuclease
MTKFNCNQCNRDFNSFKGLQNHNSRIHKISGAQTYVNFNLAGEWPICQCGCNQKLNYFPTFGFGKYLKGHAAKINGGFYSKEGLQKSLETRKERFASGELEQWNKGKIYEGEELEEKRRIAKDPVRCEKISKALTGKPKSEAHRKILCETLARNRKEILKGNPSKLEFTFADILTGLGIEFVHQYEVDGFNYDFYIPDKNILIEVDGDYWHAHPDKYVELNNMQKKNKGLDKLKTKHAADRSYQLLRFWEQDITCNRFDVIANLMEICK